MARIAIVREDNPLPSELSKETVLTVVVAESLGATLTMMLSVLKHHPTEERLGPLLASLSAKRDDLDYLLDGRNHITHLRKLYPADGVQVGDDRFACYSACIQQRAASIFHLLSLMTAMDDNERFPDLSFAESLPILEAGSIIDGSNDASQIIESILGDSGRLKVLLENERLEVSERLQIVSSVQSSNSSANRLKRDDVTLSRLLPHLTKSERQIIADLWKASGYVTYSKLRGRWAGTKQNPSDETIDKALRRLNDKIFSITDNSDIEIQFGTEKKSARLVFASENTVK